MLFSAFTLSIWPILGGETKQKQKKQYIQTPENNITSFLCFLVTAYLPLLQTKIFFSHNI